MIKNFNGCRAIIYNEEGEQLDSVTIWEHDVKENSIEVQNTPALTVDERCRVLILTDPIPYISQGSIHMGTSSKIIRLFKGDSKENRQAARYKVDIPASIEGLVYNNTTYPLHNDVDVTVVSISKSGVRFLGKPNTAGVGDWLQLRLKVEGMNKAFTVKVARCKDRDEGHSEYGCRLLAKEEADS